MKTAYSIPARQGWRSAKFNAALFAAGTVVWATSAVATLPSGGYADLVEKVSPAVVFISTTHKAEAPKAERRGPGETPFPFSPDSPYGEFFKQFRDQMPEQKRAMKGLGSGFVIDPTGHIVTNNHVIHGASKVQVKMQDGREFTAKVIGKDAKTDLALLKIQAVKPLPYVKFGNSAKLRVGNVVLAVGNPFGLGGTVTAGIVSARNRDINAGPYDDFIQTDAVVNRGNSGGPLFNTNGDVVGVNTAIYSPNGGSVGIGFAIPANLAKEVVAQLKDHGNVDRGWLGVKIQLVSPEIAQAIGLDFGKGALIAGVTPGSPAAKSGLRQGDVVLGYNGNSVKTMRDLPSLVATTRSGETAMLELWRNGRIESVSVTIGRLKPDLVASANDDSVVPGSAASSFLGADLAALDNNSRAQLGLPETKKGVVIARIEPEGRAAAAGLRRGDVIEKVGSIPVASPLDVDKAIAKIKKNAVLLLVNRGGETLFVGVKRADA
ncbi:MAG: DegQ family serine endoprotease [Proteobacteria bacterium]|nr:DegQ family serine endoprotease [Pseudomonadota bacterium]